MSEQQPPGSPFPSSRFGSAPASQTLAFEPHDIGHLLGLVRAKLAPPATSSTL